MPTSTQEPPSLAASAPCPLRTCDTGVRPNHHTGRAGRELFCPVGGMGLTGVITRATWVNRTNQPTSYRPDRTADIDGSGPLTDGSEDNYATLTAGSTRRRRCPARPRSATRGRRHPRRADRPSCAAPVALRSRIARFPDVFPTGWPTAARAGVQRAWYRQAPRGSVGRSRHHGLLQVLDLFGDWNRIYRSRGFLPVPVVVPFGPSRTSADRQRSPPSSPVGPQRR